MALLPLHSYYLNNKPHLLLHKPPLPYTPTKPKLTILAQDSSSPSPQSSKPTITTDPTQQTKPSPSPGQGFGPAQPKPSASQKKKGDRVIRRSPVERPAFLDKKFGPEVGKEEQSVNESAFLVAWLGLGGLIFVEGIALAASGFLPEEWDKFFVKILYPSFTPTVFLFVACSVVYGVFKYFQNEKVRNQK